MEFDFNFHSEYLSIRKEPERLLVNVWKPLNILRPSEGKKVIYSYHNEKME